MTKIKIYTTPKSLLLFCSFLFAVFSVASMVFYADAVTFCSALCDNQGQDYTYNPTQCICHTPLNTFDYNSSKINDIEEIFINIP